MPFSPVAEPLRSNACRRRGRARMNRRQTPLLLLGALLLSACTSGPAARLYVLEPVAGTAGVVPVGDFDALGVAAVTLPGYARDPRVATRSDLNRLYMEDQQRWAESPEDAITRVFAERLRYHADATVLVEPFPRGYAPDARVEVNFDRLLRTPEGGVDLAGQITLLAGDGRSVLSVRPFRLVRTSESTSFESYFLTVSKAVDDLARMAVARLIESRSPA